MSWGTDFKADLFIRNKVVENVGMAKDFIEEYTESLASVKESILMYCSANPRDITPTDWEDDAILFIKQKLNDLFEEYEDSVKMIQLFNFYVESKV
jgi:hypothetical protein